jgi:hypothetical protein
VLQPDIMDKRMDFLLATTDYREKCNYKGEREMIDKIENIALLALVIMWLLSIVVLMVSTL